jgi:kynurenine formamidase
MTAVHDAVEMLSTGRFFELEHDRFIGAPIFPAHWPGFIYTLHRRHEVFSGQARTSASGTITMQEHSGTHIDALCHQAVDMKMYGDIEVTSDVQTPHGFTELGAETIPPIFRRGLLLDVPGVLGVDALDPGYLITGDDLARTEQEQGTTVGAGDCVLVRTGNGRRFIDSERYLAGPGVGRGGAVWLAERRPFLCGADNVAFDVPDNADPDVGLLPCHTELIVRAGIYIVENLNLEELAEVGCHEFVFTCLPMKLRGVTGSPVRPVAIAFDK